MSTLLSLFDHDPATYAKNYLGYLAKVLDAIDVSEIAAVARALERARDAGRTIFLIGNGGSASTASHMANDLAIGSRLSGRPFRTMSLCDNNSILTAVGNDFGYEEVFTRQLKFQAQAGDLLIAISASGNSPNLVHSFAWAKDNGLTTIALTSFVDGGKIRRMADLGVHVPTDPAEYGPAEDAHLILNHLFVSYMAKHLDTAEVSK
jgi:D-sedoheptulose 7-phosphate isomerase